MRVESVISLFDEETQAKILASIPRAQTALPSAVETTQFIAEPVIAEPEVPVSLPKVPLHRLYSPRSGEHYYTTKAAELDKAVRVLGYNYENLAAHILPSQAEHTVPLYRVRKDKKHVYTTNVAELAEASAQSVVGYVHETLQTGTFPFYRLFNPQSADRLFTTSIDEKQSLLKVGWQDEGVACYVYL